MPQMVACVGCVWLKLDIVVTAAISYDENLCTRQKRNELILYSFT